MQEPLNALNQHEAYIKIKIKDELGYLLTQFDTLFRNITNLIYIRGYKDYGYIGKMRENIHALENAPGINIEDVLSLRRHEKDYLLRNENAYIEKLNYLTQEISLQLQQSNNSSFLKSKEHLIAYQRLFNSVVELDKKIGIRGNIGIKQQLDIKMQDIENQISNIVLIVDAREKNLLANIKLSYAILIISFILASILVSIILSKTITRPLLKLSEHINEFVSNGFVQNRKLKYNYKTKEIREINRRFNRMAILLNSHEIKQKQSLAELIDEQKRYQQLAELLPLSVFESDKNGHFWQMSVMKSEHQ